MKKVFLYLYPIKEYISSSMLPDELYDEWNIKRPLPILNECIQKRYRDNEYQVVFVLYPDKEIYGVIPKEQDKIIYTDILYSENSAIDKDGKEKENFIPKFPNEQFLIKQFGNIDKLVIGGFHYSSCVKRIGKIAIENGIDTTIDLDLTDLFFDLYRQEDYFIIEHYDPRRYKEFWIKRFIDEGDKKEIIEKQFQRMYDSLVYRFDDEEEPKLKI